MIYDIKVLKAALCISMYIQLTINNEQVNFLRTVLHSTIVIKPVALVLRGREIDFPILRIIYYLLTEGLRGTGGN